MVNALFGVESSGSRRADCSRKRCQAPASCTWSWS